MTTSGANNAGAMLLESGDFLIEDQQPGLTQASREFGSDLEEFEKLEEGLKEVAK